MYILILAHEGEIMNHHIYPLQTVLFILDLAEKAIDFDFDGIFRIQNNNAFTKLKEIVFANDDFATITKLIDAYNQVENEKYVALSLASKDKIDPPDNITSCEWAALCKEVMQDGVILNKSIEVICSRFQLLKELKTANNNPEILQNSFLNFLGQLCQFGHEDTANALHQYLHLLTLSSKNKDSNIITTSGLAAITGNSLLDSLDLSGLIFEKDPSDLWGTMAMKLENEFIAKLTDLLLNHSLIESSFSSGIYAQYGQSEKDLVRIRESILSTLLNDLGVQQKILSLNIEKPEKETKFVHTEQPPQYNITTSITTNITNNITPTQPPSEKKTKSLMGRLGGLSLSKKTKHQPDTEERKDTAPPQVPQVISSTVVTVGAQIAAPASRGSFTLNFDSLVRTTESQPILAPRNNVTTSTSHVDTSTILSKDRP